MSDELKIDETELQARARLIAEAAKIPWRALQRFFAKGSTIYVAFELDLIEVAYQISADNTQQVEQWRASGLVGEVSDARAHHWLDSDAIVWSVVVRPWVLVQPISALS